MPKQTPIYLQLVEKITSGFSSLSPEIQEEISDFIDSQQDKKSGGFYDRAGKPDSYYSLFGLWLSLACNKTQNIYRLKKFVKDKKATENTAEFLAVEIIRSILWPNRPSSSFRELFRKVMRDSSVHLSYRLFLLTLALDTSGKINRLWYVIARLVLCCYFPGKNTPASLLAALIFARKTVGLNAKKLQQQLLKMHQSQSGFKLFREVESADMLSTAVALFALNKSKADLRMIAPDCLNFVQYNYDSGAFLAGNGDDFRDLEYTFYGLLVLGSGVKG